jgi:TMEM175 potassium channel family protein
MSKGRLEAFSDGVIAILITIMVLELRVPHDPTWHALRELAPKLFAYALSFVFLGIYWNNHHHMFHATRRITGGVLWANLHLLFWLSLVPFATAWMGENHNAAAPTSAYGVVMMLAGLAYYILERTIIAGEGPDSTLAEAIGQETKGVVSVILYGLAIPLAFAHQAISDAIYVTVALMWLVPDRRIEATVNRAERQQR